LQPHQHNIECTGKENYCHNMNTDNVCNDEKPWCYTTDPNKVWDYCNIPMCAGEVFAT